MAVSIRIRIMTLLAMLVFCGTACTDRKAENPEPEAAEWAQEILISILDKPAESLFDNELRAFQYAIDAGVQFVMTEHLAVPAVADGSPLPASVDPKLIRGILREKLGFTGIVSRPWRRDMT